MPLQLTRWPSVVVLVRFTKLPVKRFYLNHYIKPGAFHCWNQACSDRVDTLKRELISVKILFTQDCKSVNGILVTEQNSLNISFKLKVCVRCEGYKIK